MADLPAVHYRQHDVEQHDVRLNAFKFAQAVAAVGGAVYFKAVLFQVEPHQLTNICVVFYD